MAAALVITGLAGSMFFDLGNILQSNHSEVKFWRGDWVRKKTERHEKKIPFPDRRTKNAAVETAMQQFFPLNFFDEKKRRRKVCAPADNDNDHREERNLKKSALFFWTPYIVYNNNNITPRWASLSYVSGLTLGTIKYSWQWDENSKNRL